MPILCNNSRNNNIISNGEIGFIFRTAHLLAGRIVGKITYITKQHEKLLVTWLLTRKIWNILQDEMRHAVRLCWLHRMKMRPENSETQN